MNTCTTCNKEVIDKKDFYDNHMDCINQWASMNKHKAWNDIVDEE